MRVSSSLFVWIAMAGLFSVTGARAQVAADGADGSNGGFGVITVVGAAPGQNFLNSGTPGQPGSNGLNGNPPEAGGNGGNGGNGGPSSVDVFTVGSIAGTLEYIANGARGGDGGAGGTSMSPANGGNGGDGGVGGSGANLTSKIDGPISADVNLVASGGDGGTGGTGGTGVPSGAPGNGGAGGAGGNVTAELNSSVGGNLTVTAAGGAGGGSPGGVVGVEGAGGSIQVTVNGTVSGEIVANAGTGGSIQIVINTGATVSGPIGAALQSTSSLTLNLDVLNGDDYDRAAAIMNSNVAGGRITVDGRTYAWDGFDTLVNQLRFTGVRQVTFTTVPAQSDAAEGESSPETGATLPNYLSCSPRAVTAFPDGNGVRIVARPSADQPAFLIGQIEDGRFVGANALGWRADIVAGASLRFTVADATGTILATCTG